MSDLDVNFLKSRCDSAVERAQKLGLLPIRGGIDHQNEPLLALIDILFERMDLLERAVLTPIITIEPSGEPLRIQNQDGSFTDFVSREGVVDVHHTDPSGKFPEPSNG